MQATSPQAAYGIGDVIETHVLFDVCGLELL
jgi:hypothetical protein